MFQIYDPHPDAVDWYRRAIANGGTITPKSFDICENYVKAIELAGLRTIIATGVEMVFIGSNLAAALTPLYRPAGSPNVTSFNFVAADYSESTGLNPGSGNTTKYISLGVNPSAIMSQNSGRVAVYSRSNISEQSYEIGSRGSSITVQTGIRLRDINSGIFYTAYDGNTAQGVLSANNAVLDSRGFFCGTRNATNLNVLKNGVGVTGKAINTGGIPATSLTMFAMNNNGSSRVNFSSKILSHGSAGAYLNGAQVLAQYNAIQAKETALGRQV